MLKIYKLQADHTIDFAAEELKKYMRMMMPETGDIIIAYDPAATEGFRLGLLEDFHLTFNGKDTSLDDEYYIDMDTTGGYIAGSNPRSVLFGIYRYFKKQGVRFMFPGAEGEYVPLKDIVAVKYHKLADHRLRGHSIEGAPSVEQVLNYIDWHAKEELNSFGSYDIFTYMRGYYRHTHNEANRAEEYMDDTVAETQWRALFECELEKRGQRLHGGGHSLMVEVMGLDPKDKTLYANREKEVPEDVIPRLAMINGKRQLYLNKYKILFIGDNQINLWKDGYNPATGLKKGEANIIVCCGEFVENCLIIVTESQTVTYDFESEEDGAVTVRDRDTMQQERIKIDELDAYFAKKFEW